MQSDSNEDRIWWEKQRGKYVRVELLSINEEIEPVNNAPSSKKSDIYNSLQITRETEPHQNNIRFIMSLSNNSPFLIVDVVLGFIFDEKKLRISGNSGNPIKNRKFLMGNIDGDKSKSVKIDFEPLTFGESTIVECQVTYTNHAGNMYSFFMQPKEIKIDTSIRPGLKNLQHRIKNSIGMEFVLIPSGEFEMGSNAMYTNEKPVHEVTIKNDFYLGKYVVTQKQWLEMMDYNPSWFKDENNPVTFAERYEVQEFIRKLNEKEGTGKYRLPSEAEWEYACRAGTTNEYSFGDDVSKLGKYARYKKSSRFGDLYYHLTSKLREYQRVGKNKPNPWGLYDMHGNVWELTLDKWHDSYKLAPIDGSSWEDDNSSLWIVRGGCYGTEAALCRSAARKYTPTGTGYGVGFRLLKEL